MNKKLSIKILALSIVSLLTLSSCSIVRSIIDAIEDTFNSQGDYIFSENNVSLSLTHTEGKAGTNTSLKEVKNRQDMTIYPSLGDTNLLVIPVYFSDFTPEKSTGVSQIEAKENIYNAFFGESDSTGWESLTSYYSKSSYGKLKINGTVSDWCPLNKRMVEYAISRTYDEPSVAVLREAVDWYKTNYPDDDITKYDLDGDGYLDGVVIVYANEYYNERSSSKYKEHVSYNLTKIEAVEDFLWAYTYWDSNAKASKQNPVSNVYMFASYSFMWDGGYEKGISLFGEKKLVDSHTYIHEFGHMLGLDDYYSYDSDGTSPIGGLDMMDNNIGDHNAYSKYLLGWIEPNLVTEPGSYSFKSLVENGEAILIPAKKDDFAYSPFDEYLLIELYSPNGLNYQDAKEQYCGNYPRMFNSYGIRIFHVDSRLVVFDKLTHTYFYTKVASGLTSTQDLSFYCSNTISDSCDKESRLISLISRDGVKDYYKSKKNASNNDLFITGTSLNSYSFHNGEKLKYKITVEQINVTNKEAIITLSEK